MTQRFKDLSELHAAAIDSGQPEMFKTVLDGAIWKTRLSPEYDSGQTDTPPSGFDPNRILPFRSVREIFEEEEIPWKVQGILASGNITEVSGAAKLSGKTTLLLDMTSCLLEGLSFIGCETEKSDVAFLTEQGNNLKESLRLVGLGPETEGLHILQYKDVRGRSWPELAGQAREYCVENGIDVLFVDTMAEFGQIEDENLVGPVRNAMQSLKRAAQNSGLAVAYTRHFNKQNKGRGSSQFEADCDFFFTLQRPLGNHKDTLRVLHGEGRSRAIPKNLHIDLQDGGYVAVDKESGDDVKFKQALRAIRAILPRERENAKPRKAIHQDLKPEGHSESTIKRALHWMVDNDNVRREGAGKKGDPERFWMPAKGIRFDSDQTPTGGKEFDPNRIQIANPGHEAPTKNRGHTFTSLDPKGSGTDDEVNNLVPPEATTVTKVSDPPTDPEDLAERFNYIHTDERAADCLAWARKVREVALDTETVGLLQLHHRIRLVQLHADGQNWSIDADHVSPERVAEILREFEDKPKYIHNAAFDMPRIYRQFGVALTTNVRDTLVASRGAYPGDWGVEGGEDKGDTIVRFKHGLEDCLERELGVVLEKDRRFRRRGAWNGSLTEDHLRYAEGDVAHLKTLYEELMERIDGFGVREPYEDTAASLRYYVEAGIRGVPVDIERLSGLLSELETEMSEIDVRAQALVPEKAPGGEGWKWMNASKPEREEGRRGALRALSLAGIRAKNLQDRTLERLAEKHELAGLVRDYRMKRHLVGKYKRWESEFYENGRVYPQFQLAGTVTNRTTYKDPNVQGMDKRNNHEFRRCVRAAAPNVIVKGDWSQQEVRIAAHFSRDPAMIRALSDPDKDVYMIVAEKLLGRPVEKGSEERQNAKRIVLGFLYGLGIERYIENTCKDYPELGVISKEQAEREREAFREAFQVFYSWQRAFGSRAGYTEEDFETRSVLGRRRVVAPDASGKPKYTDRLNGPIQTTGADVLYRTLGRLMEDQDEGICSEAAFLFSSHDEIVFECPETSKGEVMEWLGRRMREVFGELIGEELAGPASVEVSCGQSWAEDDV